MKRATIPIILGLWFGAAFAFVSAGGMRRLPFPPPLLILPQLPARDLVPFDLDLVQPHAMKEAARR